MLVGGKAEAEPVVSPGDWMSAMLKGRDRIFHSPAESGIWN